MFRHNGQTHFQILLIVNLKLNSAHSLQYFESLSDQFGTLNIKGLRVILEKKFMEFTVTFQYFNLLVDVS